MALRLSDSTFRMYRKGDGRVSFRLNSRIMILAVGGISFRLSAYLSHFEGKLTLESGTVVPLKYLAYTDDCLYRMDTMVHEFWVAGEAELDEMKETVGLFRLQYALFHHPSMGPPDALELVVPVVPRGRHSSWMRVSPSRLIDPDARGLSPNCGSSALGAACLQP